MRYQPSLDALRGLSVTAVFVYHAGFFNGGWIGVQIFFVLSGYLITSILDESLHGAAPARVYFGRFYLRRTLRIFPVYFVYVAIVLLAAKPLLSPQFEIIAQDSSFDAPYLLTYTYNLFKAFNPESDTSFFFGHLWSLSIEEQFYLLWPALLFYVDRRHFVMLCFALVALGPLSRGMEALWEWHPGPHSREYAGRFVYFFTLSHFDAFAAGALVYFSKTDRVAEKFIQFVAKYAPGVTVLLGLWMLLLARLGDYNIPLSSLGWPTYLPYYWAFIWGFSLLNFVGVALIVRSDLLPHLFNNVFTRRLGRVSYGFYIFHLPTMWAVALISGVRQSPSSAFQTVIVLLAFLLTWLVAETSFRFLETPFLKRKAQFAMSGENLPRSSTADKDSVNQEA